MTTSLDASQPPAGTAAPPRPVVTALALIAAGSLWLLHMLDVSLRWELILPIAVIVIGLTLLLGGRSSATAGLVPIGVVTAVLAVLVAVVPGAPALSIGDRDHEVTDLADLEAVYGLGVGDLVLDLRQLDLPPGTTAVEVGVGVGQLEVLVPADVTAVVDATAGAGKVTVFGAIDEGVGPGHHRTDEGAADAGTLEIEARVGLGQLEVTR